MLKSYYNIMKKVSEDIIPNYSLIFYSIEYLYTILKDIYIYILILFHEEYCWLFLFINCFDKIDLSI